MPNDLDGLSLADVLRTGICRPSKKTQDDPHQMGYRLLDSSEGIRLLFNSARYATAEALVMLGTLIDIHESTPGLGVCEIVAQDTSSQRLLWATGLSGFQGRTVQEALCEHRDLAGCFYAPLSKHLIGSRDECFEIAKLIEAWVRNLPTGLQLDQIELPRAVARVVQEALLNVYDHAYKEEGKVAKKIGKGDCTSYLSLTVTPARLRARRIEDDDVERQWLETVRASGLSLEIAVGDAGCGIPRTLWRNFSKHHATEFEKLAGKSLGSRTALATRAHLQALICRWALDHRSTRRTSFPNPAARLSPRGLHKALNTVLACSGTLMIRSGCARVAHVARGDVTATSDTAGPTEQPGTTVVARFPNRFALAPLADKSPHPEIAQPVIDDIISISQLPTHPGQLPKSSVGAQAHAAGIDVFCFPFSEILQNQTDELSKLNYLITNHAPNRLFGIAFLRLSGLDVTHLRSYSPECRPAETPPRLCALIGPDGAVSCRILGHLPDACRSTVADLEKSSVAFCEAPIQREMAEELAHIYPSVIRYDQERQQVFFRSSILIDAQAMARLFQTSIEALWTNEANADGRFVLSCGPREAFRLTSGRLVRRLFSITLLLQSNHVFAEGLVHLARLTLSNWGLSGATCVVADSPSSYLLAQQLLGEDTELAFGNGVVPPGRWKNVLVFCDAVWQGDSLNQYLARLGAPVTLCLICADLSKDGARHLETGPLSKILFRWPFDPEPLPEGETAPSVLELDVVTNLPQVKDNFVRYELAETEERVRFLRQHPELLRVGLHIVASRIHTVSVNTESLVQIHAQRIRGWIFEIVAQWLTHFNAFPDIDVLLIGRQGAAISRELHRLGLELDEKLRAGGAPRRVFVSLCANVPRSWRSIYSRSSFDLSSICSRAELVSPDGLLAEPLRKAYAAVYVDDATISGHTLLNVLTELASDPTHNPIATLVVPLVMRLSPQEERFLSKCALLQADSEPEGSRTHPAFPATLAFHPLFRLQVQCFDSIYAVPFYHELGYVAARTRSVDLAEAEYVSALRAKLPKVAPEGVACSYPWWPEVTPPVSSSYELLRLRHLLSILAQNEGGLGQVCDAIFEAARNRDLSTLSLFAIEPTLLDLEPLLSQLRPLIVELAEAAVEGNSPEPSVSNAMAVLWRFPLDFVHHFQQMLRRSVHDGNLMSQLSLLAGDIARRKPAWAEKMENEAGVELTQRLATRLEERLRIHQLQDMLASVATGASSYEDAGPTQIEAMLRAFYVHSAWHTKTWQAYRFAIINKEAELVREATPKLVDDLRKLVLPAFLGLRKWSAERGNARMVDLASEGYRLGNAALRELSMITARRDSEIQEMAAVWRIVLSCLVESDIQYFLSEEQIMKPDVVPKLQRILTTFFFSPGVAAERMYSARLPDAFAPKTGQNSEVSDCFHPVGCSLICSGTLTEFRDVMTALLDNIQQHGISRTASLLGEAIEEANGKKFFRLMISNQIGPTRTSGHRQGLHQARLTANRAGWTLQVQPDTDGSNWTVIWTIPIAFMVSPLPAEAAH